MNFYSITMVVVCAHFHSRSDRLESSHSITILITNGLRKGLGLEADSCGMTRSPKIVNICIFRLKISTKTNRV